MIHKIYNAKLLWKPRISSSYKSDCMQAYLSWGGGLYVIDLVRTNRSEVSLALVERAPGFFTLKQQFNLLYTGRYCFFDFSSVFELSRSSKYNFIFTNLKRIAKTIWFKSAEMNMFDTYQQPPFYINPPIGFIYLALTIEQAQRFERIFNWFIKRGVFNSHIVELPTYKKTELQDGRVLFFIEKKYKINPYQQKHDP